VPSTRAQAGVRFTPRARLGRLGQRRAQTHLQARQERSRHRRTRSIACARAPPSPRSVSSDRDSRGGGRSTDLHPGPTPCTTSTRCRVRLRSQLESFAAVYVRQRGRRRRRRGPRFRDQIPQTQKALPRSCRGESSVLENRLAARRPRPCTDCKGLYRAVTMPRSASSALRSLSPGYATTSRRSWTE
jgi:hypothetical protein